MPSNKKIDFSQIAFIFDHDGVLADTEEINFISWKKIFELQNKAFTRRLYRDQIHGYNSREVLSKMFGNLSEEKRSELRQRKALIFNDLISKYQEPIPGAIEFVKKADLISIKIAVGSMAKKQSLDISIKKFDIADYLDVVLTAEDVVKNKPDPEIYLKAINALGVESKNCVIFEDSPAGLEAASKSGAKVIFVNTSKLLLVDKTTFDIEIANFDNIEPNDIISRLGL